MRRTVHARPYRLARCLISCGWCLGQFLGPRLRTMLSTAALSFFGLAPVQAEVFIALLDTGVNVVSPLTDDVLATGGRNFVDDLDDSDDISDISFDLHGTAMAQVLVSEAPDVRIIPLRTRPGGTSFDPVWATAGLDYATTATGSGGGAQIILRPSSSVNPADTDAVLNAAAVGKIVIMQAGNNAMLQPTGDAILASLMQDRGLIAGGLDTTGSLLAISNQAGDQANWYVTAPGYSEYYPGVGSSIAAAHTASLAARVLAASPHLTAEQVTEIIRKTATDQGEAGVDAIYGWGQINPERALQPVGDILPPSDDESSSDDTTEDGADSDEAEEDGTGTDSNTADNSSGSNTTDDTSGDGQTSSSGGGLALAALVIGGAVYAVLRNNKTVENTLVLDEYGRAYELDLKSRVTIRDPGVSAGSVLKGLDTKTVDETLIKRSDFQLSALYMVPGKHNPWNDALNDRFDDGHTETIAMSVTGFNISGYRYGFGYNAPPRGVLYLLPEEQVRKDYSLSFQTSAFGGPLRGFTAEGLHGAMSYAPASNLQAGLSFASAENNTRYGLRSQDVTLTGSYHRQRWGVGLQLGLLEEDGSLLGGSSGGVLSVAAADTVSASISGHVQLADRVSLIASYTEGMTHVENLKNSFLRDFTSLRSNTWGVGLIGGGAFRPDDVYGFAWAQPLRISSGSVEMLIPYTRDREGRYHWKVRRTSMVPDGSESSLELFYKFAVNQKIELLTYLAYRMEPLHDASAKSDTGFMLALKSSF